MDNFGLSVLATSDYLAVVFHIVGTSNNAQDPITKIGEKEGRNVVFYVVYIQDTNDQYGDNAREGHYQSLEPIPMKNIPCYGIIVLSEPATDEVFHDDNDRVLKSFCK